MTRFRCSRRPTWRKQHVSGSASGRKDRRHIMYVIGKTGTGKSTLLATLLRQRHRARTWRRACRPARRLGRTRAQWIPEGRRDVSCLLRMYDVTQRSASTAGARTGRSSVRSLSTNKIVAPPFRNPFERAFDQVAVRVDKRDATSLLECPA